MRRLVSLGDETRPAPTRLCGDRSWCEHCGWGVAHPFWNELRQRAEAGSARLGDVEEEDEEADPLELAKRKKAVEKMLNQIADVEAKAIAGAKLLPEQLFQGGEQTWKLAVHRDLRPLPREDILEGVGLLLGLQQFSDHLSGFFLRSLPLCHALRWAEYATLLPSDLFNYRNTEVVFPTSIAPVGGNLLLTSWLDNSVKILDPLTGEIVQIQIHYIVRRM